jgi:hypothetical protein
LLLLSLVSQELIDKMKSIASSRHSSVLQAINAHSKLKVATSPLIQKLDCLDKARVEIIRIKNYFQQQ